VWGPEQSGPFLHGEQKAEGKRAVSYYEKLTYRYAGRDFRLTDVEGSVVHELLA
jgi:hypothetical protein